MMSISKSIFSTLIFLFFISVISFGQSGKVKYETTVHIERPEGIPTTVDIPKKRISKYELTFADHKSLYVKDTEYKDPEEDNRRRRWRGSNKPHFIYRDSESNSGVEQVSFFKKEFLVSDDTLADLSWKLVPTEQRDILGYTAIRAILNDTTKVVEAWFTPQVPVSSGPLNFYGLPGLILALTVDEKRVILATEVEISDVAVDIVKPSEGKKMNREDFIALKEEKTEEMKKMWGGSKRRWGR